MFLYVPGDSVAGKEFAQLADKVTATLLGYLKMPGALGSIELVEVVWQHSQSYQASTEALESFDRIVDPSQQDALVEQEHACPAQSGNGFRAVVHQLLRTVGVYHDNAPALTVHVFQYRQEPAVDACGHDNGYARVDPDCVYVRDGEQRLENGDKPVRGQHQRVAAAEYDLFDAWPGADVLPHGLKTGMHGNECFRGQFASETVAAPYGTGVGRGNEGAGAVLVEQPANRHCVQIANRVRVIADRKSVV